MMIRNTAGLRQGYVPSAQFKWQLLILLPFILFAAGYLLLGRGYWGSASVLLSATAINAAFALAGLLVLDYLSQRVAGRFPGMEQAGLRIFWLVLLFAMVSIVLAAAQLGVYAHWGLFGFEEDAGRSRNVFIAAGIVGLVTLGIFETLYSHKKWRENTLEKEQLKKSNLQSQYESLKNQINPHFLFNTLNSLSSLIVEEPDRAEEFISEMAKVYRYLLQTNQQSGGGGELTSLANELVFIQSYFHLLKTRYGQGISLSVEVPEAATEYLLPPLSLQMLVENAIKHNVIHKQMPLMITICVPENGRLEVRNNFQPRNARVLSNGVGLSNISEKYRLLALQMHVANAEDFGVIIDNTGGLFVVSLPLL